MQSKTRLVDYGSCESIEPLTMNTGLSLEDALRGLASGEDLAQLDALGSYAARPTAYWMGDPYKEAHNRYCALHEPLELTLLAALRSGEFVARGFELPLTPKPCKAEIAAEAWEVLEPDFEDSSAKGGDLRLIKIEVWKRSEGRGTGGKAPSSDSALVTLSEDDRLLMVKGHPIYLRGEIHQGIIRQLVDAYHAGIRLRQADVLAHAGSNADTIAKAFNGSPNWRFLDTILVREKGECWLQID